MPAPALCARLVGLISDATAQGARSWLASPLPPDRPAEAAFPPALLWPAKPGMACMEEEVFGPLLPLVPYETLPEAMAFVRDRPAPLALYWFDPDTARARRLTAQIPAGGVGINAALFHAAQPSLPFGGIGESGIGQYRGRFGFDRFSHLQAVYQHGTFATRLVRPPYGAVARWVMAALLRWG